MESMENQEQSIVDTIAPEMFDTNMAAVLGGAPGCSTIGSFIPDRKRYPEVILNNQFQLTGLLSPEGRLIAVNEAARALTGIMKSELIGKWFWETHWWAHSEEARNRLKEAVERAAGGVTVRYETTNLDKNGDVRNMDFCLSPVVDENGDVMYLVPEGLDITEAKKRETALRESEERYRILTETANEAIFMMDGNMFVECNQKCLDLLQCTRKEIIGRSIIDFSPQEQPGGIDSKKAVVEKVKAALEGEPQHFKWTHTKHDGTPFEAELHFNRIDLSTGPNILGHLKDVTKRNRLENERRELQERLQQSRKMEAVGTLAAGIAHDFNNILAPIIGYAELTMEQAQREGSTLYKYQDYILQAALRAKELIQQVLAFSRKGDEVIKPVKVKTILKETLKLIRASLPSNIDIVEAIDSDGLAMSSPTHIQQIVMNLCTNAGHAMKENGGVLQVKLWEEELDEEFTDGGPDLSPGRYIKLTVGDTGHGIPPEIQRQIFDLYFTTKEKGEGTGLGLSVVHGIVKDSGGEILIDSEPGKGSVFSVYLPAVSETGDKEKSPLKETPHGSENILLVDDEKPILEMYTRFLERLGYSVTSRISSVEALAAFKWNPDVFDLVITDMTMPDMTGTELAKEMAKCRSDIPIILNTGYSELVKRKSTEDLAVDALMRKPVVMSDLAVTIRQLIKNSRKGQSDGGKRNTSRR